MPILIGKPHDLVLDGWTVACARALDRALVHGCAVNVLADDAVRLLVGVGEVALRTVVQRAVGQEREGRDDLIAGLRLHLVKVDGSLVDSRRRAGFEAAQRNAQFAQRTGQMRGGEQPLRAALPVGLSDDDAAVHVHARTDDGGLAGDLCAGRRANPGECTVLGEEFAAFALPNLQIRLGKERVLHAILIGALVRLCAQGMDGRPLAGIEHTGLNERVVDGAAHFTAQRVDFAHQMSLARAADGGIAGHERNRVQIQCEQQRSMSHACARKRCLAACVASADDNNLELIHTFLRKRPISKGYYSIRRRNLYQNH